MPAKPVAPKIVIAKRNDPVTKQALDELQEFVGAESQQKAVEIAVELARRDIEITTKKQ